MKSNFFNIFKPNNKSMSFREQQTKFQTNPSHVKFHTRNNFPLFKIRNENNYFPSQLRRLPTACRLQIQEVPSDFLSFLVGRKCGEQTTPSRTYR